MRLRGRHWATDAGVALNIRDGLVTACEPDPQAPHNRVLLPAFVNAHDHGRALRTAEWGAPDAPLELWIPTLALLPEIDIETAATLAFGRLAQAGYGTVVHFHGSFDPRRVPDEAAAVARAAQRVGIRLAFIVPLRDANRLAYGKSDAVLARVPVELRDRVAAIWAAPVPEPAEQVALVDETARRVEGTGVDVQFGPVGPQWCSDALLSGVAAASAASGRRIHTHLLESRRQRRWADAAYPGGYVEHLDRLGLLSERLTVAHGVWLTPREAGLLAARGAAIVLSPSSNLRLSSGVAPAAAFKRAGVALGLGCDSMPLEDREDGLRHLALAQLLYRGTDLAPALSPHDFVTMACMAGARLAGRPLSAGLFAPGEPADVNVVEIPEAGLNALAGCFDPQARLVETVVAGRTLARDGRLLTADLAALAGAVDAEARAKWRRPHPLAAALSAYQAALRDVYAETAT
ncbi:MAG TPA: amidohydrolase family protein [Alphaproteobacteria bacterium]